MTQQLHSWVQNIPKRIEKDLKEVFVPLIVIAALSAVVKRWKQTTCPSVGEWTNKMWYMHAMEYSHLRRKEILARYNVGET